jgi:hypothetical protein
MNRSQIIALYDQDQRVAVEYPDTRREVTPHVVRHVNTSDTGEGSILHSRLDETNVDDVIREQIAYFQSIGQDFEWKLYDHDRPSGLMERLVAAGFEVEDAEAIMFLDLETAPAVLLQPVRHTVVPVTDVEMIEDVLSIERQVFRQPMGGIDLEALPQARTVHRPLGRACTGSNQTSDRLPHSGCQSHESPATGEVWL